MRNTRTAAEKRYLLLLIDLKHPRRVPRADNRSGRQPMRTIEFLDRRIRNHGAPWLDKHYPGWVDRVGLDAFDMSDNHL